MQTMLSLGELEAVLMEEGTMDEERLRRIIKQNATNGGVLRKAAKKGLLTVVKFFLEAKDKFELTAEEMEACSNTGIDDKKGNTLLHTAASNGHVSIVIYLLASGEEVNVLNKLRESPLYVACREGHERVVKLLVLNGADAHYGKAPIAIAATNGWAGLVRFLLESRVSRDGALSCAAEAGHADVVAIILERCAEGGLSDLEHLALHQAARKGHIHILEMLLNAGGDASRIDDDGFTPMAFAAEHGYMDIVQLLLSRGTEPLNNANKSPLDCAIASGHIGIARLFLLHGFTLNKTFVLGRVMEKGRLLATLALLAMGGDINAIEDTTALHIACASKQFEMVRFLLQRKMNINAEDNALDTPLHIACMYAGNESIIQFLINRGAKVNALNQEGCTPLLYVKDLPSRKILIESGGDPHIPNSGGTTTLHMATTPESIQLLLQSSVLVDARTAEGLTALMGACLLGHADTAETLVQHGACVNTTDYAGQSPLIKAIRGGSHKCVKFLLENGAVVNKECKKYHRIPLHFACRFKDFKSTLLLLKWGAAVNSKDSMGNSPLYYAAAQNACGIIQLLSEYGAHVNSVNNRGQVPLHVVRTAQAACMLIQKGADSSLKDKRGMTALDSFKRNIVEVYHPM